MTFALSRAVWTPRSMPNSRSTTSSNSMCCRDPCPNTRRSTLLAPLASTRCKDSKKSGFDGFLVLLASRPCFPNQLATQPTRERRPRRGKTPPSTGPTAEGTASPTRVVVVTFQNDTEKKWGSAGLRDSQPPRAVLLCDKIFFVKRMNRNYDETHERHQIFSHY